MTYLEAWIQTPFAQALGSTLLHFLWEGALVALLLAAMLRLSRPASPRLRYGVTLLAMLAMPIVFGVTIALSLPLKHAGPASALRLAKPVIPPRAPDDSTAPVEARLWDRLPWLTPVWMAGVLLFYARSLAGWMMAQRLRRIGVCAAPAFWQERLQQLARGLGLERTVALLESCLTDAPVVIGFFRPVILMPLGLLTGFRTDQLEYILIHELAHILRHDYLVSLLQSFVEGLLFYHPAVWWVSGLVRQERENCCDDAVVALRGDARGYAAALAALEQNRWMAREAVLAATGGSVMKRIRRLLGKSENPRIDVAPALPIGLLLVSAALAATALAPKPAPLQPSPGLVAPPPVYPTTPAKKPVELLAQAQAKPTATLETPYKRWLNEDVVYIITDAERQAWSRLQTDEELQKFIEQFWLRRDPTPGTGVNGYRREHYRRIAYANERYHTAKLPGWKTDRGRIYITFGPPDEIEDHSSAETPFQQWRYRHIDGIGDNIIMTFIDRNRTGEYIMSTDPPTVAQFQAIALDPMRIPGFDLQVGFDGMATISVPVAEGAGPFSFFGRVRTSGGRVVNIFEDTIRQTDRPVYRKYIRLAPGTYVSSFVLKDTASGAIRWSEADFEVK